MANAVEDALSRASTEQREKAQATIEEARRNIKLVSMRDDISSMDADSISKNAQVIEEARRNIPIHTMQNADMNSISAPPPSTVGRDYYNSNVIELHPDTQASINSVEMGGGNNYLRENAVDRAQQMPSQNIQGYDQQEQALGR